MPNALRQLAPVVIFVYNRPDNARQVIEALQKNYLAPETDVIVFSDGPKNDQHAPAVDAVRSYLKTVSGFKSFTVVERKENYYIERNIVEGVTEIVNEHGRIIVLEDDGVTAPYFLTFMNMALDFYDKHKRVMHIATFTFIKMPESFKKTFLWRYSENTGGGWATWKDRWASFRWFQSEAEGLDGLSEEQKDKMQLGGAFKCLDSLKLKPIPWDICWYVAITKANGLAANSPWPLVRNNGLFNGTHFTVINRLLGKSPFEVELSRNEDIEFEDRIEENQEAITKLKNVYGSIGTSPRERAVDFVMRILVTLRITKLAKRFFR